MREKAPVPYIVHEGDMVRLERVIRRLWILCIIIFAAFIVSNAGWIYYESQFMDETTEVTQDIDAGDGGSIVNGDVTVK